MLKKDIPIVDYSQNNIILYYIIIVGEKHYENLIKQIQIKQKQLESDNLMSIMPHYFYNPEMDYKNHTEMDYKNNTEMDYNNEN